MKIIIKMMNTMTLLTLCAALAATGMWMKDNTPRI